MDLQSFDDFCASLPSTEMVIQWGGAHVWKVGGKVFALCSHWGPDRADGSWKIAFKASDLGFQILREQPGIIPAPYLGRYKWVQIEQADALSDDDLKSYIEAAHAIIAKKLTKAARRELGLA